QRRRGLTRGRYLARQRVATQTRPAPAPYPEPVAIPPRRRHRDRRGRGPRGPLAPRHVPLVETPTQRFDEIVLDAVEHVETRWRDRLATVDFAVEEVPPVDAS